jgi:hypothetical protein
MALRMRAETIDREAVVFIVAANALGLQKYWTQGSGRSRRMKVFSWIAVGRTSRVNVAIPCRGRATLLGVRVARGREGPAMPDGVAIRAFALCAFLDCCGGGLGQRELP